ncbi:MAG: hypothetical protein IJV05_10165 [Muribaculaceae bacterium]|nr:hypothetical protein [Muribaculaceae bacterium]
MALLVMTSAGAPMKRNVPLQALQRTASMQIARPQAVEQALPTCDSASVGVQQQGVHTPRVTLFYRRPAGAFNCEQIWYDGDYFVPQYGYVFFKPWGEYHFIASATGLDEQSYFGWNVYHDSDHYEDETIEMETDISVTYDESIQQMPSFFSYVSGNGISSENWYCYQHPNFYYNEDNVVTSPQEPARALAVRNASMAFGDSAELLLSSKTFRFDGNNYNKFTYYTFPIAPDEGVIPETEMWFGKNNRHYDGIAQAFEKPEHPYVLKKVYLYGTYFTCSAPVMMTCKVYRLDTIPEYDEVASVSLPEVPGELIVNGEGWVMPDNNGMIEFTLYDHDEYDHELTLECTPTIDDPILIVIEGYNDPEMADLKNFSAYAYSNFNDDEGYGELAYLKTPVNDEDGNFTGEYIWHGLNNYFGSREMKTGFSIFIAVDQPFLAFRNPDEDGVYTFPVEGGLMEKGYSIDDAVVTVDGIEFLSSVPSVDGEWNLTWNGVDEVPEWLEIELSDVETDGEFSGIVKADVAAEPLPEGVFYREATIRFAIPGDYRDYKFIQGEKIGPVLPPEPSIATLNELIDMILSGTYNPRYDFNGDGVINIADINLLIDIILTY